MNVLYLISISPRGSFAANLAVPRKGSAKCFRNHSAYLEVISIDKCEMNGDE